MKWIIYWTFYVSSLGDKDISGTITVTDSTVTTYALDYQYITWNITSKKETKGDRIYYGEYFLERNKITSYLVINQTRVYQYIATEPPIHIYLTRKDETRYKSRR